MNKGTLFLVAFLIGFLKVDLSGHDHKATERRSNNTGKVLVFSGTGWYRHPETAAISGWLARLSDELKMQVDITESSKDLKFLDRYQVLVLNNSNQLTSILDPKQRKTIEDWYAKGGGIVALHAALVRQRIGLG